MVKNHLFELTPLGKADKEVRGYLKDRLADHQMERYQTALQHYRHMKMIQATLKVLLYASIITSIAAIFGIRQIEILQKIASYLGTTVIFVLFAVTSYLAMIRRESYHVQREILISQAASPEPENYEEISGPE
jgi:hypothetical protein